MHRLRLELFQLKAWASLGSETDADTGGSGLVWLSAATNQALLTATKDLASAEAHLDPGDGGWWLLVQGRWSPQLASADLPHRRDGLFLALHRLVTTLGAEGGASVVSTRCQGAIAIASTDRGMPIASHRCGGTHHLLVKLPNHQHLQGLHAHQQG